MEPRNAGFRTARHPSTFKASLGVQGIRRLRRLCLDSSRSRLSVSCFSALSPLRQLPVRMEDDSRELWHSKAHHVSVSARTWKPPSGLGRFRRHSTDLGDPARRPHQLAAKRSGASSDVAGPMAHAMSPLTMCGPSAVISFLPGSGGNEFLHDTALQGRFPDRGDAKERARLAWSSRSTRVRNMCPAKGWPPSGAPIKDSGSELRQRRTTRQGASLATSRPGARGFLASLASEPFGSFRAAPTSRYGLA